MYIIYKYKGTNRKCFKGSFNNSPCTICVIFYQGKKQIILQ